MCIQSATEIDAVSSQKSGIPVPLHIIVDRDSLSGDQKDPEGFVETEDYVELNGMSGVCSGCYVEVMQAFTWTHSTIVDTSLAQDTLPHASACVQFHCTQLLMHHL